MKHTTYTTLVIALTMALTASLSFAQEAAQTDIAATNAAMTAGQFPKLGQMPPGGPQDDGKDLSEFTATRLMDHNTTTLKEQTIESTQSDQNTVLAKNGAVLTIQDSLLNKSGDTTSGNGSNFNGQNAVFLAADSTAALTNTTITSDAEGANAIFATGKNARIIVNNVKIQTRGNSSRGLDATYDGTIIADHADITTKGAHCAALATDRGEGTVTAANSILSTAGDGSPCVYSTGNITLSHSSGIASGSEIAVVEGKNSITLDHVNLTGAVKHGVMLYQSFSGDADKGTASFTVKDSTLRTTSDGPMFYVTNTQAKAYVENTNLKFKSHTLIDVTSDQWGDEGANGGNLTFTASRQELAGNILANDISTISLHLQENSTWKGAMNPNKSARSASIQLDKSSSWTVTATSYVTALTDADRTLSNIDSKGYTIYYDAGNSANTWLKGKTLPLTGGGQLAPRTK